eukprot:6173045-Pleurochrysis_carterae.AAC.3
MQGDRSDHSLSLSQPPPQCNRAPPRASAYASNTCTLTRVCLGASDALSTKRVVLSSAPPRTTRSTERALISTFTHSDRPGAAFAEFKVRTHNASSRFLGRPLLHETWARRRYIAAPWHCMYGNPSSTTLSKC